MMLDMMQQNQQGHNKQKTHCHTVAVMIPIQQWQIEGLG